MDINKDIYRVDHISASQLKAYLLDRCTPAEQHHIERHLLNCELCQDALEGFELIGEIDLNQDLIELNAQVQKRIHPVPIIWRYLGIAASLALIMVAAWVVYPEKDETIAMESQKEQSVLPMDTLKDQHADSSKLNEIKPSTHVEESTNTTVGTQTISKNNPELAMRQNERIEEAGDLLNRKRAAQMEREEANAEDKEMDEFNSNQLSDQDLVIEESPVTLDEVVVESTSVVQTKSVTSSIVVMEGKNEEQKAKKTKKQKGDAQEAEYSDRLTIVPSVSDDESAASRQNYRSNMKATGAVARSTPSGFMVYGTVFSDDEKEVIPGVIVMIKNTSTGTVTDIDGRFILEIPNENAVLVFGFIGYTTIEKTATPDKENDVYLAYDVSALEEVVVVGYGSRNDNASFDNNVMVKPRPKAGYAQLKKEIQSKMVYPAAAIQNKIEGKVKLSFEIDASGAVSDINVEKGLGYGCDEEAIQLIKTSGYWIPGTLNDHVQQMKVTYSIKFKLPE